MSYNSAGVGSNNAASAASMGYGQASQLSGGAEPQRTALQDHLIVLQQHTANLHSAIARIRSIGDRLLGNEPQALQGAETGVKAPSEPPLMIRVDYMGRDLTALLEQLHGQINRLERI